MLLLLRRRRVSGLRLPPPSRAPSSFPASRHAPPRSRYSTLEEQQSVYKEAGAEAREDEAREEAREEALAEEEAAEDEAEDEDPFTRTHPHTLAARSRTHPTTVSLPGAALSLPTQSLLPATSQLSPVAHKIFGGPGLPWSGATPASARHLPQKSMALTALQSRMTPLEADSFLAAIVPSAYASVMHVLVELRQRLGHVWLRELLAREEGPRILDVGGGGAAVSAWRELLAAEWSVMQDEIKDEEGGSGSGSGSGSNIKKVPMPTGTATVVVGSDTLTHRASRLLQDTSFLPRLPGTGSSRRYDVIVAPYTLWPIHEAYKRKLLVSSLWSLLDPDGGVLILLEKGLPRGFEAIAGARAMLLQDHLLAAPSEGAIIAPCPTHSTCPLYTTPGPAAGRKDYCHFSQRYIRPSYLQHLLGASERNTADALFSYLAARRGAPLPLDQDAAGADAAFAGYEHAPLSSSSLPSTAPSLPRNIRPPLKRHGHVAMDVCTPAGAVERWVVPRSFSRQAYRDARKAAWGDLWALGAKTRTERGVRIGKRREEKRDKGKGKKEVYEVEVGEGGRAESVRRVGGKRVRREISGRGKRARAEGVGLAVGGEGADIDDWGDDGEDVM
ncbi:MAG: 37S ribosomal protein S22 [Trizodia sp. TS-e1964]|nr:MAG: 37S ribosomal protein S22 [Trizodia sp. TS-e1964]